MFTLFSDALSRMESQHRDNQKTLLDKLDNNKDCLASHLSELSRTHHGALATEVSHVGHNIREDVSNLAQETRVGHNELIGRSNKQMHELKGLSSHLDQVHKENNSNLSQVVGLCFGNMLKNDHRFTMVENSFRRAEKQLLSVEEQQAGTQSQISTGFRSVLYEVDMIGAMGRSVLSMLVPFSEKALEYLRKNMKANMEIYALLLKIQTSIPQGIFASRQDSVHFEDVLGRKKLLPYDYFRHWDVFDSMLRCEFKDLPGEQKVIGGDYVLMDSQVQGVTIGKKAWQRMVFPGTKIKMSVVLETFEVVGGFCPRPNCPGTVEISAKNPVVHCPVCTLVFVHAIADNAQPPRFAKSEHEPQEYLGKDEPLKARELNEIQAFRMVHVIQSPSRTEEIQRLIKSSKSSFCSRPSYKSCEHRWMSIKAPTDLLQWSCQRCHSGPHWFIQECQICESRYCGRCTQKSETRPR